MPSSPITVETVVPVSREAAWDAYTTPDHITRWNFASPDWTCPSADVDLREGGRHTARMEAKDGSFGFDFTAIYEAIEPERSFTYRMEDGRIVTTTFEQLGDTTRVTTVFDAETENPVDMQRDGWQAILNNFKAHAESL